MKINPAPLKKRFGALFVDYFILVAYGFLLLGVSLVFYNLVFEEIPDLINIIGSFGTQFIGFVTLTLPVGLYFYFTESSKRHASLGKRAMKISVKSMTGVVSKQQIAIRTIIKLLPWEFAHAFVHQVVFYSQNNGTPPLWVMVGLSIANILPLIYLGFIIFRKDHRGPHDLAAKTLVVSTK
jgi:uncharacterized RDD family membrane protein YckC